MSNVEGVATSLLRKKPVEAAGARQVPDFVFSIAAIAALGGIGARR